MRSCSSSHRLRLPTPSSCSRRRASAQRTTSRVAATPTTRCEDLCRSLDGLPLAIELAAARTKTLSIEEITRRLDDRFNVLSDPTSRRPERRRALKSTIRWSYDLLFPDDQRGLWALATFAGGAPLPAVESVLEALDVPAAAAIDVVGRLASRSLVIVDDESADDRSLPAARQHPRVRARSDDRRRDVRARPRRARGMVRRRRRILHTRCAQQSPGRASRLRPGRARQHRRRVGVEHRARPAARAQPRQRVRLGMGRPRRQQRRTTDPGRTRRRRRRRPRPRPGQRPAARGVDRSVDRSPRTRPRPHRRRHRGGRHDQRRRPASALLLLPRLRRVASTASSAERWS